MVILNLTYGSEGWVWVKLQTMTDPTPPPEKTRRICSPDLSQKWAQSTPWQHPWKAMSSVFAEPEIKIAKKAWNDSLLDFDQ